MVDVTISLIGANNDEIVLEDNGDFVLTTGVTGFGIAPTSVRIDPSAGAGGTWRFSKRGVRDIDLPIAIMGTSRSDVETKLRRLAQLLQDTDGPTKIVANYSDGSSVFLEAHYVGGAETQFGTDANNYYCRWVIQMQAPQPYWATVQAESFTVGSGSTGRGLLPQLTKLKVSSSQALGIVNVNNPGAVPTYPVWTMRGPVDYVTVSNGTVSFTYNAPIADGETITINTESGEVTNQLGVNKYANLGAAPKLFPLPAGLTSLNISGTGATANTVITCFYSPKYEVIH
jgi:hypothetical protein